ncbi:MAG: hypothetical protein AAF367_03820 [Pseudomonadota bacterium]
MSEILASIRKIVTDEEETRRSAADERRRQETETGAEVFVLTGDMRAAEDAEADEPTLELTLQDRIDSPKEPASEDSADEPDSDDALELTASDRADAPLELGQADRADRAEPETPLAALAPKPSAPIVGKVDFTPTPGLTEDEVEKIVRRVLREELQGPIGQQISRKVKAMIRDEVAKSLLEEESLL